MKRRGMTKNAGGDSGSTVISAFGLHSGFCWGIGIFLLGTPLTPIKIGG